MPFEGVQQKIENKENKQENKEKIENKKITQEQLNELATQFVDNQLSLQENLQNNSLDINEKNILSMIENLDISDNYIQNWFTWLDNVGDENFIEKEKELVLRLINADVDDEGNIGESDFNEEEFNMIGNLLNKKQEICEKLLNNTGLSNKTKIIDSCNKIIGLDDDFMKKTSDERNKIINDFLIRDNEDIIKNIKNNLGIEYGMNN